MPTVNAEGYIRLEGGVGEVSVSRVFGYLPISHGSSAFAVGMLPRYQKKETALMRSCRHAGIPDEYCPHRYSCGAYGYGPYSYSICSSEARMSACPHSQTIELDEETIASESAGILDGLSRFMRAETSRVGGSAFARACEPVSAEDFTVQVFFDDFSAQDER